MNNNQRDIAVCLRIIRYCNEIEEAMDYFGRSLTDLKQKTYYKNAVAMCILQISELTGHLSEDFKVKYKQMSW